MVILQLDEQPPLIQAVFSYEIETVRKLLESKQDVNYQDFEKRSALHAAAYRGDAAMSELLIEHGARVNTKDCRWVTPLHRACCSGSEETVCVLLKNQADTGARDRLWQTPLHIAAAYNSLECVQCLLERIQNPNVTDRSGRTALHHAVLNGHNDIVELLISKGCIVNACDKKDCRPIHWAAHKGHTETIEILLQNGADINAKDRNQYTSLHVAAASGSVGVIQTLLMHGASIEAQNAYGNTPLHIACLNGHGACAQELIRHSADKEAVNYRGQTPLHIAAASTHGVHCLNMLVGLGVNINRQSADGRTALHMTAIHGRFTRSKTLIDNGAVVDSVDKNGCTALHIAAQYGHELLSSTLLTYGANASKKGYEGRTPLHMCCLSGYIECCRIFIKAGVDLNSIDDLGKTPLHCAAYKGAAECVDLLVSSGSDIKAVDSLGRIPLHYASAQGYFFCIFTLVGTGSDPNSQDNEGCTALHLSSAYDIDGKCVNYLLEHRADPKMKDLKGFTAVHYAVAGNNINALRFLLVALGAVCLYGADMPPTTPLHIAAKNGNMEILESLMPYFPDPNVRNEDGCSPLLLAARQGYANCVQMLLRFGAKVSICDSVAGLSPVHHSAKNGYVHCLALLVDNAEDKNIINEPDSLHRTALMLAVSNLHVDCVTTLIKSGADPNVLDNDGHSCLFRAVVTGQHSVLHMLLPRSTVVNTPDANGKTILHVSAAYGKLACTQRILPYMEAGVAKGLDKESFTALHWACYSGNYECVAHFFKESVFDSLDGNPFSPVHCAASSGSERCLDLLCKRFGADTVRYRDVKCRTPLHIVAIHGHTDCALYLLDHGAEIDFKDEDGRTPLMAAAMNGQIQVMEILIGYKADKTVYDGDGNTALHLACLKKHNHAALLLLDFIDDSNVINMVNNERKTPLHISARHGLVDVTRQLIAKGSSVLAIDGNGLTPALCCAPNPSVAQCLAIILASHPMQMQGANCKEILRELQVLRLSIRSLVPRPKRGRRRHLQTDITMVRDPDRFELERMFGVKLDRAEAELEFRDWTGNNVYVKFDGGGREAEQPGGPPKKRHRPRPSTSCHAEITSYSCHELHGSRSDMSLALKTIYSEEDYRKLIKQSTDGPKGQPKPRKPDDRTEEIFARRAPQAACCSFRYDVPDDTDTEADNVESYREVCETLVRNYISELPSTARRSDGIPVNPNRSPKATNKRLKPQKVRVDEFAEHFERCSVCKQFNQDIQESNPVHEPSIPLEVMKETVNKVLSKKGNSNNRCLYAFLNESFEINSDNAYMIFHGMVSSKCEPFIAKILNLTEGEVEITESTEGDDKLKYWVKKSEQNVRERRLSSTRIKEIKVKSPPRVKNENRQRDFEVAPKRSREIEPRSEPSLRNRGAIPKRRDTRKLPASRNVVKSMSYDDKFPRSDATETKRKQTETLTAAGRRRAEKRMIISTFIDGSKIDSCGENSVAVFERKPPKNQVDAELLNRIPQYLCTLTSFHSHPLFVNDASGYFRCYPTYWCVPEVTGAKKKDGDLSDSDDELNDRPLSKPDAEATDGQPAIGAGTDDRLLYFNELANDDGAEASRSTDPAAGIDDEEIEQLEVLRRLDGAMSDAEDPGDDSRGSCNLKRRAGVMDIQRYPKAVDVWAQLAEEYLKERMQETRDEEDASSQSSKKRKLTINIPRITISDDQMDEERTNRSRHRGPNNSDKQWRNVEVVEDNHAVHCELESNKLDTSNDNSNSNKNDENIDITETEKDVLVYELQMSKKRFVESRDDFASDQTTAGVIDKKHSSSTRWSAIKEMKADTSNGVNDVNGESNSVIVEFYQGAPGQTTDWQTVENNSQPLLVKTKTVESIYRGPINYEPPKKPDEINKCTPSIIELDESEKTATKSQESKISEDDPTKIFDCKAEESEIHLEPNDGGIASGSHETIQNLYENPVAQPSKRGNEPSKDEETSKLSDDENRSISGSQSLLIPKNQRDRKKGRNYSNIYEKGKPVESKISVDSSKTDTKAVPRDLKHVAKTQDVQRDCRSKSQESRSPEKRVPKKVASDNNKSENNKSGLKDIKKGSDSSTKSTDSKSKNKTDSVISMEKPSPSKKPTRNLEHNRYYSPNRRRQPERPKGKTAEVQSQLPVKKRAEPTKTPEKVRSRSADITSRSSVERTRSKTTYESKHGAAATSDFIAPQRPAQREEHKSRRSEQPRPQEVAETDPASELTVVDDETEEGSANDSMIVHPSLRSATIDLSEFGVSDNVSAEDDDTIAEVQSIEDDTSRHERRDAAAPEELLRNTILNESSSSFLGRIRQRCDDDDDATAPRAARCEPSADRDEFVCGRRAQTDEIEWELFEAPTGNAFERRKRLTSKEFWNRKEDVGLKIEYEQNVMNIDEAIEGRVRCGKKVFFSDKVMFMDENVRGESRDDDESKTVTTTDIDPEIVELSIKLPDVSFAEDIICQNTEVEYSKPGPSRHGGDTRVSSARRRHYLETVPIERLIDGGRGARADSLERELTLPESSTDEELARLNAEDCGSASCETTTMAPREESENFRTVSGDEMESSDATEADTSKYFSPPENDVEKRRAERPPRETCPVEETVTEDSEDLRPLAPIEELTENETRSTSYEYHDAVDDEIEDSDVSADANALCETDEDRSEGAERQQSMETIPEERSYELTDSARGGNRNGPDDDDVIGGNHATFNVYSFLTERANRASTSTLETSAASSLVDGNANSPSMGEFQQGLEIVGGETDQVEEEISNSYIVFTDVLPTSTDIFLTPPRMRLGKEAQPVSRHTIESIVTSEDSSEYVAQIKCIEISEVSSVRTFDSILNDEVQFLPGNTVRIMKITETCESVQKVFDNTEQFNVYRSDFNLSQVNLGGNSETSSGMVNIHSDPILKQTTAKSPGAACTSSLGSFEGFDGAMRARTDRRFLSDIEEDTDELNNSRTLEESCDDNSKTTASGNLSKEEEEEDEYESATPDDTDECPLENKYSKGDNTSNDDNTANRRGDNNPFGVESSATARPKGGTKVDFVIARSEITTSIALDNRTQPTYLSSEDTNEFVELPSCNATKMFVSDTTLDDEDTMNIEDNLSEDEVRTDDRFLGQILEVEELSFPDYDFHKGSKRVQERPEKRTTAESRDECTDDATPTGSVGHVCPRIKLTQHYVEENHAFGADDCDSSRAATTEDESCGADDLSVDSGGSPEERRAESPEAGKRRPKPRAASSTDDEESVTGERDTKHTKSKKSFPSIGKIGKKSKKDSNCKIT